MTLTSRFVFTSNVALVAKSLQEVKEIQEVQLSGTVWLVAMRDLSHLNMTCAETRVRSFCRREGVLVENSEAPSIIQYPGVNRSECL